MRILFLTHRIPFPPNKGDKIRSFHLLEHLARRHDVHLATLIDSSEDVAFVPDLASRVKSLLWVAVDSPLRKPLSALGLLWGQAITTRYFHSARLQAQIDDLVATKGIDAVLCFSSPMAEYVFRSRHVEGLLAGVPKLMDLIDIDSFKWEQYAARARWPMSAVYRREAGLLAAYERRIGNSFDRLFVVTEQETAFFPGALPPGALVAMSNGVNHDYFSPAYPERLSKTAPTLVFTGVMDYWPNVEGVLWFVRSVLPLIRRHRPDVATYIVGSKPTAEIRRLHGQDGVHVTGFVDDVRRYVASADVCIAPLRIARGVQNKVLEAMAMGRPVVATSQAFEGIAGIAGEDLVVADGEAAYAESVLALLADPHRAAEINRRARQCVESRYDWTRTLGVVDDALAAGRRQLS